MISTESSSAKQRVCCVPNCNQNFAKLFKFPENEDLALKWKENLGIQGFIRQKMKVCNQHFEESAFRRKNIQQCAIPTKMLGREPIHKFYPKKRTWRVCCVPSCRIRAGNSKRLFEFPKNPEERKKWALACNISKDKSLRYVCERHFEPRFLGQKKLCRGALPKLYLHAAAYNGENYAQNNLNNPTRRILPNFELQSQTSLNMPIHVLQTHPNLNIPAHHASSNFVLQPQTNMITPIDRISLNIELPPQPNVISPIHRISPNLNIPAHRKSPNVEIPTPANLIMPTHRISPNFELQQQTNLSIPTHCMLPNFELQQQTNLSIPTHCTSSSFESETKPLDISGEEFQQISTADNVRQAYLPEDEQQPELVLYTSEDESEAQQEESLNFESTMQAYRAKINELYKKIEQLEKDIAVDSESPAITYQSASQTTKSHGTMNDDFDIHLRYVKPGIHASYLHSIKQLFVKMPEAQKKCVLVIDEIPLRRALVYNKLMDTINGYTDLGNGERSAEIAEKATFIMIKSLVGDWKFIVSYYLTKHGLSASQQIEVVLKSIKQLKEILELQVIGIVCDHVENNIEMLKLLKVNKTDVSFNSMDTEIFLLHNYYHLQRSIRDTLLNFKLKTTYGIVDFDHIRKMFVIDQFNKESKVCPNLTPSHIEPKDLERMDTGLATEILNDSVANGLAKFIKMGLLSPDALATSIFVKKMSDLFDLLDCKTMLSSNPLRRAVFRADTEKRAKLVDIMDFLSNVEVLGSRGTETCIKAYISTITAILKLCAGVFQSTPNVHYIFLAKLGQDALANVLRKIRLSTQAATSPSANELHYIVARLTSTSLMQNQLKSNPENYASNDPWIDLYDADSIEAMKNDIHEGTYAGDSSDKMNLITVDDLNIRIPNEYYGSKEVTEVQVQRYFAGYAMYQEAVLLTKCRTCHWQMKSAITNADNEVEFQIFRKQMIWFKLAFSYLSHMDCVGSEIYRAIYDITNLEFKDWYDNKNSCCEHRKNVLKLLITILLFKNAKWLAASCEGGLSKRRTTNDDPTNANKRMKLSPRV